MFSVCELLNNCIPTIDELALVDAVDKLNIRLRAIVVSGVLVMTMPCTYTAVAPDVVDDISLMVFEVIVLLVVAEPVNTIPIAAAVDVVPVAVLVVERSRIVFPVIDWPLTEPISSIPRKDAEPVPVDCRF